MDAAAVVEVFDPGGDPGVDLVAGGEGTPGVVLGCEGGPQGFGRGVIPAHSGPSHRYGSFHNIQVDPAVRATQVAKVRDPHASMPAHAHPLWDARFSTRHSLRA